jgi:hypothetical protein
VNNGVILGTDDGGRTALQVGKSAEVMKLLLEHKTKWKRVYSGTIEISDFFLSTLFTVTPDVAIHE